MSGLVLRSDRSDFGPLDAHAGLTAHIRVAVAWDGFIACHLTSEAAARLRADTFGTPLRYSEGMKVVLQPARVVYFADPVRESRHPATFGLLCAATTGAVVAIYFDQPLHLRRAISSLNQAWSNDFATQERLPKRVLESVATDGFGVTLQAE